MAGNFAKKSSKFFLSFFIGIIVISFIFTGYESIKSNPDTVAMVGDLPVKVREYENEFRNQVSFYKSLLRGKELSSKQIEQMRIKENALNNLIVKKLWLKMAKNMGLRVSEKQVIDKIKEQSYFLTDKQFDFEKYKALLQANGMTTHLYENLISKDLSGLNARKVVSRYPISENYIQKIRDFKNQKIRIHAIEIDKDKLKKHLKVSRQEVATFLANPENLKKVQKAFEEKKTLLSLPKSAKNSSPDVQFEDSKWKLAEELIRGGQSQKLDQLWQNITKKVKNLLATGKLKKIKSLKKRNSLKIDENVSVNLFNGTQGKVRLPKNRIKTLFKGTFTIHIFEEGNRKIVAKTFKHAPPKKDPKTLLQEQKQEKETMEKSLGRKLSEALSDRLKKETSIKIYSRIP